MKKQKDWNTKANKRSIQHLDKGIVDVLMITNHFFPDLPEWVNGMKDPREKAYCTYTPADYVFQGLLKNICGQKTMTEMDDMFNEETCIHTLSLFSGDKDLEEMPHKDSLNYYLSRLDPEELSGIREKMVKHLIRTKQFNQARLSNKSWRVILDGTGIHSYREKPDDHCLRMRHKDADGNIMILYYRKVLEAKLVVGENRVISLGTEFIENENETVTKQDCETNAAKRLLAKLKSSYPKMHFCIQGDGLYAVEPLMKICRGYGWDYLYVLKEGTQETLVDTYEYLKKTGCVTEMETIGKEKGNSWFANDVEEMAMKEQKANIFEYRYQDRDGKERRFLWVTNIKLTKRNLEEMVNAGRGRWDIENKGFNEQKNGIYDIEHLNSHNYNAIKNHYLLVQIADIIFRLYLWWSKVIRATGASIKNTSSRLLESFRRHTVTDEDVSYIKRRTSVYLEV